MVNNNVFLLLCFVNLTETLFTQNIKVKNKNNQRRMNKNVDIKFSAYEAVLE